ncbi:MAG: altronate dehydratase [Rhodobacteraceae bacterium]|jgi:altronate hydrolase|uniref:Altronate hydrolase n=1 Tax=Salipiger profundus TaxID=1229727 RepID=A0A1U7D4D6_9RHOB|nr:MULTISPECIES: altronate dehydratase family protein [Salipiger]APX22982.1 altronate hydrolase [Salipiger profundus]MAB04645.1 altronate dehydratase [Paracoccaceae bacterium]GGA12465.1 altronate hydrolase [Salipiger profundus]SFD22189.1 altronate hydrolase [Salipiger profundus]
MTAPTLMILDPSDTVAVVLTDMAEGEIREGLTARAAIPRGHKIARSAMAAGSPVLKYGQVMAVASRDIAVGEHVHVHNCALPEGGAGTSAVAGRLPDPPARTTFEGYARPDGRVGTRNYIGILASVNCSTTVCDAIAAEANRTLLPKYPGIDGFAPIVHDQGCGMANRGEGFDALVRTLKGYRDHPNFGGVLIVGLGCEVNQLTLYKPTDWTRERFQTFNIQEVGGSRSAVRRALELLEPIAAQAGTDRRSAQPVSELTLGMQCGGSDGFSGITANPALGVASDLLVAAGGTSILSETPEIYGAEHLLIARAGEETGARLREMIAWWRDYAERNGASLDNNPSPGNKKGGLTTILEKSLGAVAKGGLAPVAGAYAYAERIDRHGFVYMDSPGYDPVAATGQVASGANLIAFTTGRGSCFGAKPAPSIKLASNSDLARSMPEDIDIDCGGVVEAGVSLAEMGQRIYDLLLDVASGKKTTSEEFGYGDNEFVPWKIGAVL